MASQLAGAWRFFSRRATALSSSGSAAKYSCATSAGDAPSSRYGSRAAAAVCSRFLSPRRSARRVAATRAGSASRNETKRQNDTAGRNIPPHEDPYDPVSLARLRERGGTALAKQAGAYGRRLSAGRRHRRHGTADRGEALPCLGTARGGGE